MENAPFLLPGQEVKGSLRLPMKISLEKEQARLELALVKPFLGSLC